MRCNVRNCWKIMRVEVKLERTMECSPMGIFLMI
jgi:hypothetical protein